MPKIKEILKELNDNTNRINKTDYIIMGIMVLMYGILSFWRLGDTYAPKTFYTANNIGDSIQVDLKEESFIDKVIYWTGLNTGNFSIMGTNDGIVFYKIKDIEINNELAWNEVWINTTVSSLKFVANNYNSTIGDVFLYDAYGNRIDVVVDKSNPLVDEQELNIEKGTYLNSTYFDEIYYGRSAYEYVHGIDAFEWSHPPLGKLIIAIPVFLFGYSPFTIRLMGNICGIFMIPLMYILCKKVFKNRKYALLGAILMMFDTFHFVHTRIALVDGFEVLFIMLSVLFMKNYLDLEKKDKFKKKAYNLLLSGTFIGCAIATKWNAGYVAFGLAIVFFMHLAKQYDFHLLKYCKKKINVNLILKCMLFVIFVPILLYYLSFLFINKNVAHTIILMWLTVCILYLLINMIMFLWKDKYLLNLFSVCFISFIVIPIVIYVLSYILFPTVAYYDKTLLGIIDQTKLMYNYHSNLVATHPYSSSWYSWPIMYKPVWFYSSVTHNNMRMTISDIGNPFIWWFGVIAFIYLVVSTIKKNSNSKFILVFILASFIPYIFIGRIMFMYHYFITIPFVMLGIVAFIKWLTERYKNDKVYWVYICFVILGFIIFYPIASGLNVSEDYIKSLRWLSSWYF